MKQFHPLLIVEDDPDDCDLMHAALVDIGVENEVLCFKNGAEALRYLKSTSLQTFLILSDVNMPMLNGFQLKEAINSDNELKRKSIPFVFFSTSASEREVTKAYEMMVQGYYKKPNSFDGLKDVLQTIVHYWSSCVHPNSFN